VTTYWSKSYTQLLCLQWTQGSERLYMNVLKCLVFVTVLLSSPAWSDKGSDISLNFTDIQTSKILKIIADFSGKGLVLPDPKLGVTSVYLKNVPWREALHAVTSSENLNFEITDNLIIISEKRCTKASMFSKEKT